MNNLERLTLTQADKTLLDFITQHKVESLVLNSKNFNRGDFFEMALTHEPTKRTGLHVKSQGDFIFNGHIVEIKYLTKKTGASKDKLGTIADYYLIGFNTGSRIEIRLIHKTELVTRHETTRQKITYQDNINKGVRVNL